MKNISKQTEKEINLFKKEYICFEWAWETCQEGDKMLKIAYLLGVDNKKLVLTKALIADTVVSYTNDNRCKAGIISAKEYSEGKIDTEDYTKAYLNAEQAERDIYNDIFRSKESHPASRAAYHAVNMGSGHEVAIASSNVFNGNKKSQDKNKSETADICREVLTKEVIKIINKLTI